MKIKCKKCGNDDQFLSKLIKIFPNNPRLCSRCIKTPLQNSWEELKNSLNEQQKKLFNKYAILHNHCRNLAGLETLTELETETLTEKNHI